MAYNCPPEVLLRRAFSLNESLNPRKQLQTDSTKTVDFSVSVALVSKAYLVAFLDRHPHLRPNIRLSFKPRHLYCTDVITTNIGSEKHGVDVSIRHDDVGNNLVDIQHAILRHRDRLRLRVCAAIKTRHYWRGIRTISHEYRIPAVIVNLRVGVFELINP